MSNKGVLSWMRYVDDTFVIVENKDKVEDILKFLNSQHKNIKFTVEFQDKHIISLLDVRVKRTNKIFVTDVYRKRTFSCTYLNWNSFTTSQYEINLIKCLLDRSWKICSNLNLFHQEIQRIKLILLENEYPTTILNTVINKYLEKKFTYLPNYNVKGKQVDLSLPYGGKKSEELKVKIKRLVNKFFPQIEFNLVFKTSKKLENFFNYKTEYNLRSKVVY